MTTRYGYHEDYEYNATHKRIYFTLWSGSFMSVWEADGFATPGAKQVTLTTYNGDKVVVKLPDGVTFPRATENYEAIDAAINAALNKYEERRRSVQMSAPVTISPSATRPSDELISAWLVGHDPEDTAADAVLYLEGTVCACCGVDFQSAVSEPSGKD